MYRLLFAFFAGLWLVASSGGCASKPVKPSPEEVPSSYLYGEPADPSLGLIPGSTVAPGKPVPEHAARVMLYSHEFVLPERNKLQCSVAFRPAAGQRMSFVNHMAILGSSTPQTGLIDLGDAIARSVSVWRSLIKVSAAPDPDLPLVEVEATRARGAECSVGTQGYRSDSCFEFTLEFRLRDPSGRIVGRVEGRGQGDYKDDVMGASRALSQAYEDGLQKFFANSEILRYLEAREAPVLRGPKPTATGQVTFPLEPLSAPQAAVVLAHQKRKQARFQEANRPIDSEAEFLRLARAYFARKLPGGQVATDPAQAEGKPRVSLTLRRAWFHNQRPKLVNVGYEAQLTILAPGGARLADQPVFATLQADEGSSPSAAQPLEDLLSLGLAKLFAQVDRALDALLASGASLDPPSAGGGEVAPLVVLTKGGPRTLLPTLALRGRAQDDRRVAKLEVYRNGERLDLSTLRGPGGVKARAARVGQPSLAFEFVVPLAPGKNLIRVVATDEGGLQGADEWSVERVEDKGTIHALVVGIGAYRHARKLPYARADALAFSEYLIKTLEVPEKQVHLLLDEAATLRSLRTMLGKTLPSVASKGDTVLIFFAGHGGVEPDPSAKDGMRSYIYPVGAEESDLYATALPMDDLQRVFARIQAKRLVFISDCCYSGAVGGDASFATRAGRTPFLTALGKGEGRVVLTACKPNEVARSSRELGHGLFTHYLLEGLKSGAADVDRDGLIDTDEAFAYASKRVGKASSQTQHPEKSGRGRVLLGRTR